MNLNGTPNATFRTSEQLRSDADIKVVRILISSSLYMLFRKSSCVRTVKTVQQAGNGETTLYSRIHQKTRTQVTGKTQHLHKLAAQTDSKSQIRTAIARTKSAQRLIADQLALRTSLHRDSLNSEDIQRRSSHLSNSLVFILFLTGCNAI
ncbi:hypothetical protein AVEN_81377-1 [Araneus ventricosus]|uniref:Uncharacterized protein n=1 Tax=Araneus ventricosus TaxID=182803 RepID=A0A4Y2B6E9_ARAVE|nr:hypothetical protein AVEN_81377-1 [Araneus ventricosus]